MRQPQKETSPAKCTAYFLRHFRVHRSTTLYGRWKAYAVSLKFKEGRLVGKGVADWWVLGTRPLGMAPREPLDDTEMMQIK